MTGNKQLEQSQEQSQEQLPVVNLSPKAMVDNVSDWSLRQVVDHLRKKEKEDKIKGYSESDCRVFHSSSVRFFCSIVDEIAASYGASRGKVCRWLSYHGIAIAREDTLICRLLESYSKVRREALVGDSPAVADILDSLIPYAPSDEDGRRVSFYVYSSWTLSEFEELARVCGTHTCQVAQIFMLRSVLTCDLPILENVADRIKRELDTWDRWMRFRAGVLNIVVAVWGSV